MRAFDIQHGYVSKEVRISDVADSEKYKPTLAAVQSVLPYSIVELSLSLITFALFVNSAILIVAGSTLFNVDGAAGADLFQIHDLLDSKLSPVAGTLFALALLASGQSAGVGTTKAGQLVSEGFFEWTMRPWLRRLITRSKAILPCILVAGLVGRSGLATILNANQVVLSILLPFIAFPIIWFTGKSAIMKVNVVALPRRYEQERLTIELEEHDDLPDGDHEEANVERNDMRNSKLTQLVGWGIWLTITGLNCYFIIILARG